jgi:hypothetical protein
MVYVFSRNKEDHRKKVIIETNVTEEEARKMCTNYNKNTRNKDWLEFTKDRSYAE